jgi:hypothetical protein
MRRRSFVAIGTLPFCRRTGAEAPPIVGEHERASRALGLGQLFEGDVAVDLKGCPRSRRDGGSAATAGRAHVSDRGSVATYPSGECRLVLLELRG